jgi:hypothetical protein
MKNAESLPIDFFTLFDRETIPVARRGDLVRLSGSVCLGGIPTQKGIFFA